MPCHLARNCNVKVNCNTCKGEHHTALCDQGKVHKSKPKGPGADVGDIQLAP